MSQVMAVYVMNDDLLGHRDHNGRGGLARRRGRPYC